MMIIKTEISFNTDDGDGDGDGDSDPAKYQFLLLGGSCQAEVGRS